MKTPTFQRRRSGFTLLELMVAMGITAIIVTVLVSITGVATDTWTRSRSEVRASRQAKVMLDTMAKDLESFVSRRGQNAEWLVAKIDDANLPKVAREGSSPEVAWLTFFTAATDRYFGQVGTDDDKGGDVSCVSYRLEYQDPIEGAGGNDRTKTFVLYRLLVNPDETFEQLLGKEDLETEFNSYKNDVTEEENFVCENVTQFTVTFLVEVTRTGSGASGGSVVETARVTLGGNSQGNEFRLNGSTGIDTDLSADGFSLDEIKGGRLKGVELSMSVISDAGLARITAGNGGLSEKDYARHVYHYARTVELPGM